MSKKKAAWETRYAQPEQKQQFVYFCGKCQKNIENPWGMVKKMVGTGEFYDIKESKTLRVSTYKTICVECYEKIHS